MRIKDRGGHINQVVNHLRKYEGRMDPLPFRDNFFDECLYSLNTKVL